MINTLHTFIIDYSNTGEMYRITIEGDKEEIQNCLYQYTNDCRYIKSKEKGKKDLGTGIATSCNFYYDKYNTGRKVPKGLPRDERHWVLDGDNY